MEQQKVYRVLARNYNKKRRIDRGTLHKIISFLAPYVEKGLVLDLGSGSGRILIPITKLFSKTTFIAYDISTNMLRNVYRHKKSDNLANMEILEGNFNSERWISNLGNRRFDSIILFQSIHFVRNIKSFIKQLCYLIKNNGSVIIATTTHDQFRSLPYCVAFPGAMRLELDRTPNSDVFTKLLLKEKFQLVASKIISIKAKFKSKETLRSWLNQKPFSVLALISNKEFKNGVANFTSQENVDKPILLDQFSIFVFKKI